jgi:hypothetical protein
MRPKFIFATILFILFASTIASAQTTIKAEIDKTNITTDDNITYKLTITSSEKKIPKPQLPEFKGFYVLREAQSSNISFAKNNIKTTVVYVYVLAPQDIGKFKIGPSTIKIQGKAYSSAAFEIEVKQGKAKPQALPEQKPSRPESEEPQFIL